MSRNFETFDCDHCGRELETAFYFHDTDSSEWKFTADGEIPNYGDECCCSTCHKGLKL